MSLRCVSLVGMLLAVVAARAETRYITDDLSVELRRGPSTEYLILRALNAGQAVDVLEQDSDSGYTRVRAADKGTEGWVLTRFLTSQPAAKDQLAAAQQNLTAARSRATQLESDNATLRDQLASTKMELEQLKTSHSQVSTELADLKKAAANVVEIRDQNTSLRARLVERDRQVEQLTIDNKSLSSRNNQNWFIVGAGVLLGGIVIGLVAPSLRRRRRSDW